MTGVQTCALPISTGSGGAATTEIYTPVNTLSLHDALPIKPYLLTTQFDAWHGFLRTPIDWAPITRGGWVSAVYAAVALAGAYLVFLRRDVAGG